MNDLPLPAVERAVDAAASPGEMLAAIEQLQAEVGRLQAEGEQLGRLASLGTLAATIAHEFNNLASGVTNSIRFAAVALGETAAPPPSSDDLERARRAVARCARSAERSGRLCDSILNFARPAQAEAADVADVAVAVGHAVEAMVRHPEQDGIRLALCVPPEVRVAMAPLALEQVLLNLLLNACRALLAKPAAQRRLTVRAGATGGAVELAVEDTGCGIAAADLPRVFDRFFSAFASPDPLRKGGSGLGLNLTRTLVERAGGTVRCASVPGRGSTFSLTLPRAP